MQFCSNIAFQLEMQSDVCGSMSDQGVASFSVKTLEIMY